LCRAAAALGEARCQHAAQRYRQGAAVDPCGAGPAQAEQAPGSHRDGFKLDATGKGQTDGVGAPGQLGHRRHEPRPASRPRRGASMS